MTWPRSGAQPAQDAASVFRRYDLDGDGVLAPTELKRAVATELLIGRADDAIDGAVDAILLECTSCFDVAPEGQIAAAHQSKTLRCLTFKQP